MIDPGLSQIISAAVIALGPTLVVYFTARSNRIAAEKATAAQTLATKVAADKLAGVAAEQAKAQAVAAQTASGKLDSIADTATLTHKLVNSAADAQEKKSDENTATIKELTAQVAAQQATIAALTSVVSSSISTGGHSS